MRIRMAAAIDGGEFLGHPIVDVADETGRTLLALGLAEATCAPVTTTRN